MEIPYKTIIQFNKKSTIPTYLQIANSFIHNIQAGTLKTGLKLLGTRQMAALLGIHRKTIIAAYDELYAQSWIEVMAKKGTFIANTLPTVLPKNFELNTQKLSHHAKAGFTFKQGQDPHPIIITQRLAFNDGLPDSRLAPRYELAKLYNNFLKNGEPSIFQYADTLGNGHFRNVLAGTLQETRGLSINASNIITTRGSQMGFYLVCQALLKPNDEVVVGALSYRGASTTLKSMGVKLNIIPIDNDGIVVDALEEICSQKKIRAIYITSHHYHPTTVTLKPERRIKLLALAEKYRFVIIEDDYDYDFHYSNSPVLPLASADRNGLVIYIGSFTKRLAPTFRVGYVVAPADFVLELAKCRRIIDRQSDTVLELCLADMLQSGVLKRHATKSLKIYRERRDFTVQLFKQELGELIDFNVPDGGMAIWAKFDKRYPLSLLSERANKLGLYLPNGALYRDEVPSLNAGRLGFASMNLSEIEESVRILKKIL